MQAINLYLELDKAMLEDWIRFHIDNITKEAMLPELIVNKSENKVFNLSEPINL